MRLRYERKQVMLKKASNYAILSLLSKIMFIATPTNNVSAKALKLDSTDNNA